MKKYIKQFIILLLFVGIILAFFKLLNGNNDYELLLKKLKDNNQTLKNEYDSISKINNDLTNLINNYSNQIDSLTVVDEQYKKLYYANQKKMQKLQDEIDQNVAFVDTMGSPDIKSYFSRFD